MVEQPSVSSLIQCYVLVHCRTALPSCPDEDGRREHSRLLQEKFITRIRLCQEFSDRVLDISRPWMWEKVERNRLVQTRMKVEQHCQKL